MSNLKVGLTFEVKATHREVAYVVRVTPWEKDAVLESVQVEDRPQAIIPYPNSVLPSVEHAIDAGTAIAVDIIDDDSSGPL